MRTFPQILDALSLDLDHPILVAVSFGPDSMALVHRLGKYGFTKIHVAHVHHGLRAESDGEENALKEYCLAHGWMFHGEQLKFSSLPTNLEDTLRRLRYNFFQKIYQKVAPQALFLGHQADEQVETGLKRLFEGAHPAVAGGMQVVKELFGMRICRPQLFEKKEFLLAYLKEHAVPYAIDETNQNPHYLRGRMRTSLVPFLKNSFGKSIEENVLQQMEWFQQCAAYLDRKIQSALEAKVSGPYGIHYPSDVLELLDSIELDHLLFREGVIGSQTRKRLITHFEKREWGRNVQDRETNVYVEQAGLFFLQKPLTPEDCCFAPPIKKGWLSFWKGEVGYYFPEKTARWIPIQEIESKKREKILKQYSSQNTPIFLRKNVYVLEDEGKVICEFLSL